MRQLHTSRRDCNSGKSDRLLVASVPGALVPEETFAHVDNCRRCRDEGHLHEVCRAFSEEPHLDGYRAFYRCSRGHDWHTWWASRRRMTSTQVYDAISMAFVDRMFPPETFA